MSAAVDTHMYLIPSADGQGRKILARFAHVEIYKALHIQSDRGIADQNKKDLNT